MCTTLNSSNLQEVNEEYTWSDLISEGLVEFIDTEEEETCMIAMFFNDLKVGSVGTLCLHSSHCLSCHDGA